MKVDPLRDPLDGLSPLLYVATLSEIAHVDGLHPAERDLLDQHAAHFGVDLGNLPPVPRHLSCLSNSPARSHAVDGLWDQRC